MKIVINTDQIYLHGGIEKVMATKVNYWAGLPGVEVLIVTTEQQNNPPCYSIDAKVKFIDLDINYNRSKSYFSLENIRKAVKHYRKQKQLFKVLQPDIVISPNYNFDHYWLPYIKSKAKLIKERHSSRYYEEVTRKNHKISTKLKFMLDDFIDERYDKIVVLNQDEKKHVYATNAVVIPNPVDSCTLRAELSKKQVIAAGRIAPVKGFGDLITAWALIQPEFPAWQLHLYGQDYLGTQAKLTNQIELLGLQHTVFFKGNVDDLPQTMTDYSIYAMTSETECFPMVLLEAMSVGLPVISYDCPTGPRNILTDENDSFLVPHANLDVFADKLKLLMADNDLRRDMGANAIVNVQRFSLEKVMKRWESLFQSLLV